MSEFKYEPIDLGDDELIEIPVTYKGQHFILREADASDAKQYRNLMLKSFKFGGQGDLAGVGDLANLEPFLVSRCLFHAEEDPETGEYVIAMSNKRPRRVAQQTIESWPSKKVKRLFAKAKEISDLKEEEQDNPVRDQLKKVLLDPELPEIEGWDGLVLHVKQQDGCRELAKWLDPEDEVKNA